jgi:predicted phosphoribosyltransferase
VHELVALAIPVDLVAVGLHYDDFRQVTDAEVLDLLAEPSAQPGGAVRP